MIGIVAVLIGIGSVLIGDQVEMIDIGIKMIDAMELLTLCRDVAEAACGTK